MLRPRPKHGAGRVGYTLGMQLVMTKAPHARRPPRRLLFLPLASIALLVRWQRRARERAQLAALSDDALKDVGLSRGDIVAELQKPRWRR